MEKKILLKEWKGKPRMDKEKIFTKLISDKRPESKIYKELLKFNNEETNNAIWKQTKDLNIRLAEEGNVDGK